MKLYREGEKSKAICSRCASMQPTTFRRRDVPLSSGSGIVSDVLAGVCDACEEVVSIPHQSTPRIQEARRKRRHAFEARIPRHLQDALELASHELGFGPSGWHPLFRHYLREAASNTRIAQELLELASSEEARGKSNARLSMKLGDAIHNAVKEVLEMDGMTRPRLAKAVIVKIKRDVLDEPSSRKRKQLEALMEIAVA